jgi:hypothetical protein
MSIGADWLSASYSLFLVLPSEYHRVLKNRTRRRIKTFLRWFLAAGNMVDIGPLQLGHLRDLPRGSQRQ